MAIRVTVWNEYLHEVQFEEIAAVYPQGIHGCIQAFLEKEGFAVKTAALRQPEHGLTREVLESTDVLIWWGHMAHHEVEDEIVERVYRRVLDGMGLIVLHSGHASKIFQKLCGTDSSRLKWREDGEKEILWVVNPGHPIAAGLGEKIILEQEEMYGEHFDIPQPDEQVFISWFQGERCSAAAAAGGEERAKCSISGPDTSLSPSITIPKSRRSSAMPCAGQRRSPILRWKPTAIPSR